VVDSGTYDCSGSPPPYPPVINPPPPPNPPPPGGGGGSGEPPPNEPPGGIPYFPPYPPEGGSQEGDEILACCLATQQWLAVIAYELETWQAKQPGGTSTACCASVVAAIANVSLQLGTVAAAITRAAAGAGGAPVDLSGIVAALGQLVTAALAWPALWTAGVAALDTQLANIATAISSLTGQTVDVAGIVKALQAIFTTLDPPIDVYQDLQQGGFISSSDVQLVGAGSLGAGLISVFRKMGWNALVWLLGTIGWTYGPTGWSTNPASATLAKDFGGLFSTALGIGTGQLDPLVQNLVNQIVAQLQPTAGIAIGAYPSNPSTPVAASLGVALAATFAGWLLSYLGVDAGQPLAQLAQVIAGYAGLDELRTVTIAPLVRNGIAKVADMQAKRTFRQELPSSGALASWTARGLLDASSSAFLMTFNGLSDQLIPVLQAASYQGIRPFQLLRLLDTGLLTGSDIADELTFSGMRPASQARMQTVAPYLATASQRNSLIAAYEAAYVAGLYSDADLTNQINAAQQNTDLAGLILQRAQVQKLVAETKALEAEYSTLYQAGLLDDATFRSNLAAIGLQPDMVNIVAGKAEARANATLQRKTISAAAALARTTAAEERKAALKSFQTGTIGAPQLLAQLVATGLTAVQAAAWVELAQLGFLGTMRWVYGVQLNPNAAKLLTERVTALKTQLEHGQITDAQLVQALTAMNIPPYFVNAIHAQAAAAKASAPLATLTPVSTSFQS